MKAIVCAIALAGILVLSATRTVAAPPTSRLSQSIAPAARTSPNGGGVLTVAARPFHPACPTARAPSADPLVAIAAAVRRAAPHIFNRPGERPYRIEELYSLLSPYAEPGVWRTAARACGNTVANRSWAVYVGFPYWVRENRSAALSQALLYAVDTPAGWRVWYRFE